MLGSGAIEGGQDHGGLSDHGLPLQIQLRNCNHAVDTWASLCCAFGSVGDIFPCGKAVLVLMKRGPSPKALYAAERLLWEVWTAGESKDNNLIIIHLKNFALKASAGLLLEAQNLPLSEANSEARRVQRGWLWWSEGWEIARINRALSLSEDKKEIREGMVEVYETWSVHVHCIFWSRDSRPPNFTEEQCQNK